MTLYGAGRELQSLTETLPRQAARSILNKISSQLRIEVPHSMIISDILDGAGTVEQKSPGQTISSRDSRRAAASAVERKILSRSQTLHSFLFVCRIRLSAGSMGKAMVMCLPRTRVMRFARRALSAESIPNAA